MSFKIQSLHINSNRKCLVKEKLDMNQDGSEEQYEHSTKWMNDKEISPKYS